VSILCYDVLSHGIVNTIVGLSNGVFFVSMAPFMVTAYGVDLLPTAIGFIGFYNGLGGLLAPQVGGEESDENSFGILHLGHLADEYRTSAAFLFGGACGGVAILCSVIVACMVSNAAHRKRMDILWGASVNGQADSNDTDGVIVGDDERRARAQTVRAHIASTSEHTPTMPLDRGRSSTVAPRLILHQATDDDVHVWGVYY
jgi:hypothetical protein